MPLVCWFEAENQEAAGGSGLRTVGMPHRTHEARACLFRGFLSSLLPEWEPEGKQTRVRRGRERERSGGHRSLVLAWLSETGTQQPPPPFHRWGPGTSDSAPRVTEPGSLSCLCLEFNTEAGGAGDHSKYYQIVLGLPLHAASMTSSQRLGHQEMYFLLAFKIPYIVRSISHYISNESQMFTAL